MASSSSNFTNFSQWSETLKRIPKGKFANLFLDETQSDVTLLVGPKRWPFPGHKEALSSACWIFNVALCLLKLDEIIIEDVKLNDFQLFLEFLYKGTIVLNIDNVWELLKLAHRFEVKHLEEFCEDFLNKELNLGTCMNFYARDTFRYVSLELNNKIRDMICNHMSRLGCLNVDSKNLSISKMKILAQSHNTNCSEVFLFNMLLYWAKENCGKAGIPSDLKNLRRILGDVFYEIRFPNMRMEVFIDILADYADLFTTDEISKIIKCINNRKWYKCMEEIEIQAKVEKRPPINIKEESCGKFKNTFRRYILDCRIKVSWIMNEVFLSDNKKRVFCINKEPCRSPLMSKTKAFISITFKTKKPRNLIGFGFLAEDKVNLQDKFFIEIKISPLVRHAHVISYGTMGSKTSKLPNNVTYREFYFTQKVYIDPKYTYDFFGHFKEELPYCFDYSCIDDSFRDPTIDFHSAVRSRADVPCLIFDE
ncbi:BTB/POZ domain-containing protein 3-like [Lutzomyia longipalpis]|uniref:BTB/POZ domain-containing protein 3-like n=1 Tax=Lutzomyia longipalpis TaxID=7200 RepID=UPI0024837741|nr:BTB/POZ domain-containing protein 3-like [Lutzomyia longipalpis]